METVFIAYFAMGLMAVLPIYIGSFSNLKAEKKKDEEEEFFSLEDAKMFPIYGSATLFSLYLLFRFFDKTYLNYILTAYFSFLGMAALVKASLALYKSVNGNELHGDYKLEILKKGKEIISYRFGHFHLAIIAVSTLLAVFYAISKNWIISNFYGEAFATSAIQMLNLDSFKTGMMLLAGLFVYDVFWVFGTDVMVTVAKNFEAPIKVVFPKNIFKLLELGIFTKEKIEFTMLGLGDIVIPGIYVALCLQFDYQQHLKKPGSKFVKPYFYASFVAYCIGLATTIFVMHTFKAAQPALLYLSPACILSTLVTAFIRGELKQIFAFEANPEPAKTKTVESTTSDQVSTPRSGAAASAGKRRTKKAD